MPRVHGKDLTALAVDNAAGTPVAMLADTISLDFGVSVETHDTTTLGDDWMEATAGLLGGDDISQELFYDNTNTTGNWAVLTARLGIIATLSFTDGTRTVSMETLITKLGLPIAVNDMMKVSVTHKITGVVTFS